jgi:hypothetical protein
MLLSRVSSSSRRTSTTGRIAFCFLVLSLNAACDRQDARATSPTAATPNLQRFLTGSAAQNLDAHGEFMFSAASPEPGVPAITSERAGELALSFARTWGKFYERQWAEDRGGPIQLKSLEVAPRIFYAESPYGRFPDGYHPAFRRAFGPWYVVTLTSGGDPVLRVAVSAYNTDLGIDARGKLVEPLVGGNDFEAIAISQGSAGWFHPVSPERAVAHVGLRSGARTVATPELTLRYMSQHPVNAADAVWKLSLDRAIQVRSVDKGRRAEVRTLYVGSEDRLYVPTPDQPSTHRTTALRYDAQGNPMGSAPVEVPIKRGMATDFEEVVLTEGE